MLLIIIKIIIIKIIISWFPFLVCSKVSILSNNQQSQFIILPTAYRKVHFFKVSIPETLGQKRGPFICRICWDDVTMPPQAHAGRE